jgi:hypothetical protein
LIITRPGLIAAGNGLPQIIDEADQELRDVTIPPYFVLGEDEFDAAEWHGQAQRMNLPIEAGLNQRKPAEAAAKIAALLHWKMPGMNGNGTKD